MWLDTSEAIWMCTIITKQNHKGRYTCILGINTLITHLFPIHKKWLNKIRGQTRYPMSTRTFMQTISASFWKAKEE